MVLLDPCGFLLAGVFRNPTSSTKVVPQVQACFIYGVNTVGANGKFNRTNLRQTQIGKGTTPVTRQDNSIDVPFTSSPENGLVTAQNMAYLVGLSLIEASTLISPTGGSGLITEAIRSFRVWFPAGGGSFVNRLMIRDVFAGVSFNSGEAIFITHEVQI